MNLPHQFELRGTLLVALSGLLFGFMGYLGTKLFTFHFSVENMLFWRFLVASIWILISFMLKTNMMPIREINKISFLKIFALGACSYSGASAFYFLASMHIGTGVAMVIFFSFPVFVTFFSWMLDKWQFTKFTTCSLIAVIMGLLLLKGQGDHPLNLLGICYGLIASFCFALYVYGSQHTTKIIDSGLLTFIVCLGNCLIFLAISLHTRTFIWPNSSQAWFYILALGVFATALPIQLLLDGLKYISPIKASILSVLEPTMTVLLGYLLLGETISYLQVLGVVIILLGAIFIQFERKPSEVRASEVRA